MVKPRVIKAKVYNEAGKCLGAKEIRLDRFHPNSHGVYANGRKVVKIGNKWYLV